MHPVCSLSWSRSGRRVVSASTDNTVTLWDVLTGECDQKFRFPSPVLRVRTKIASIIQTVDPEILGKYATDNLCINHYRSNLTLEVSVKY